jgi:Mannosylglycerate hydrolase MGH1-like glycoside hydrolase domain
VHPGPSSGAAGRLRDAARRVLTANWREGRAADGTEYGYTRPDRAKYPDQFFWDSCLQAVAWSHIDPSRARRELRTLVAAQRPDGFIGHTIFWSGRVRLARAASYNLMRRADRATATIQPPLLAWAWAEVADRSPDDPGFRAEGLPALRRWHAWLDRERADPDGLLGILQPDESGLDATPSYDAALGPRAHPHPGFLLLLRDNRRRGFSYRRAVAEGGFHAIDPLVNAAWGLAHEGMARLGEPGADERARAVARALATRLWDPGRAIFHPLGPDGRPLRVATWAGLAPIALRGLDEERVRRIAEEQLLDPRRFWLPHPVPSVSAQEPSFRPGETGFPLRRYWRGPTWLFATRFAVEGLLRAGRDEAARDLARRTAALVLREGLREYYDPRTGRGMGARAFGVSAMALDCLARAEGASP